MQILECERIAFQLGISSDTLEAWKKQLQEQLDTNEQQPPSKVFHSRLVLSTIS
ncbi:hypothetical protein [Paenibacillus hexagrammi]|uniref:Transposase n=1 Tax=Paenibacillus hexagrammi TaxID=2908839 RepID=A0ABY3SCR3_9BACL|nr:hypothetical protein [Paenibacillus sp. YPD9-1]UJF31190.1 hypothetical protein L0M14_14975 [Paenibacillus sp. YPD9-1]